MRSIINISLPRELVVQIEKVIKKGKYSTKSEFVRDLIRQWLQEEELYRSVQKSEAEFKAGKGKILRSLADLDV